MKKEKESIIKSKPVIIGTLIGFIIGLLSLILSPFIGGVFTNQSFLGTFYFFTIAWIWPIAVLTGYKYFSETNFFTDTFLLVTWTTMGFFIPYLYLKWKKEKNHLAKIIFIVLIVIFGGLCIFGWLFLLGLRHL